MVWMNLNGLSIAYQEMLRFPKHAVISPFGNGWWFNKERLSPGLLVIACCHIISMAMKYSGTRSLQLVF